MNSKAKTALYPLKHVAIIMDGNNRWAKQRGLSGIAGHKAGAERIRDLLPSARNLGIETVSLFAFSSENWLRPAIEVRGLMSLFSSYLKQEAKLLRDDGYVLESAKMQVDLQQSVIRSQDNVRGIGPVGEIKAKGLYAELQEGYIRFDGPAELMLIPSSGK